MATRSGDPIRFRDMYWMTRAPRLRDEYPPLVVERPKDGEIAELVDFDMGASPPQTATAKKGPRVLVIDDDVLFGKQLERIASLKNIPLTYLSSPQSVKLRGKWEFEVVIIDYELQNISGVQLADCIAHHICEVPMLLVSAYQHVESEKWPKCVKQFMSKSNGAAAILDAAVHAARK